MYAPTSPAAACTQAHGAGHIHEPGPVVGKNMDSGSEMAGCDASVSHSVLPVFLFPVHFGDNIPGFFPREVYETTTPTPGLALEFLFCSLAKSSVVPLNSQLKAKLESRGPAFPLLRCQSLPAAELTFLSNTVSHALQVATPVRSSGSRYGMEKSVCYEAPQEIEGNV